MVKVILGICRSFNLKMLISPVARSTKSIDSFLTRSCSQFAAVYFPPISVAREKEIPTLPSLSLTDRQTKMANFGGQFTL